MPDCTLRGQQADRVFYFGLSRTITAREYQEHKEIPVLADVVIYYR
jgi:hypothetical protein